MTCHYHPHAALERILQDVRTAAGSDGGDSCELRTQLRCTAMLTDTLTGKNLRCPFVAVEYDSERKQERRCYRCGKRIETTDNSVLTSNRCQRCKNYDSRKHRLARARRRQARGG